MTKKNLYPSLVMASATLLFVSMAAAQSTDAKSSTAPATPATTSDKTTAKNSGHASESLGATPKASAASNSTSHETVEYKDPEDMTTRYRPGNNKITTLPPTAPTGTPAAEADAKKHVSNIKWQDREVGFPACDGASKDAAKCVAPPTPPAAPATAKPAATDAQTSKHTGKVDSFTVKQ
jgi:hypothetical protein